MCTHESMLVRGTMHKTTCVSRYSDLLYDTVKCEVFLKIYSCSIVVELSNFQQQLHAASVTYMHKYTV